MRSIGSMQKKYSAIIGSVGVSMALLWLVAVNFCSPGVLDEFSHIGVETESFSAGIHHHNPHHNSHHGGHSHGSGERGDDNDSCCDTLEYNLPPSTTTVSSSFLISKVSFSDPFILPAFQPVELEVLAQGHSPPIHFQAFTPVVRLGPGIRSHAPPSFG